MGTTHTISNVLAGVVTRSQPLVSGGNSEQSIVRRVEANSWIPRNPRIQELRFGSSRAPAPRVNQTLTPRYEGWWVCRLKDRIRGGQAAFIRHINLPVSSSSPGWPLLCQPNGRQPANRMGSNESGYCRVDQPSLSTLGM